MEETRIYAYTHPRVYAVLAQAAEDDAFQGVSLGQRSLAIGKGMMDRYATVERFYTGADMDALERVLNVLRNNGEDDTAYTAAIAFFS